MFRAADLEEMPASDASAVPPMRRQSRDVAFDLSHDPNNENRLNVRRQSRDESFDLSHDPNDDNRLTERREGGEGSDGSISGGLDTDVS